MPNEEFAHMPLRQTAYDGASEHYRLEQKGLHGGTQDRLAAGELRNLWMRSHHAIRNHGWAASAKLQHRMNLGAIKVVWKLSGGEPDLKLQIIWDEFASNPNLDGFGTLANTQDGWNSATFESGEAITRMIIKRRKGFKIPLVLQAIESEFLDPQFTGINNDKNIQQSIKFKNSLPVTYYFSKTIHNLNLFVGDTERVAIPAVDILHMFDRQRPGQWRGIPSLTPVLLPLYELDELMDATVNKQKAAQAITWIIENTNLAAAMAIGTVTTTDDETDVDADGNRRRISQAGSANVQYMNKGEKIHLSQGTDIGNNFESLIKVQLRLIAKTVGLSAEMLTGDLEGISFSSLKFIINEMKARAEFIYQFQTISLGLQPLCNRFQELAGLFGNKKMLKSTASFQLPRRRSIDDLKDTQADLLEITSSLNTLENKLSERNLSLDDIIADKAKMEAAGIMLVAEAQSENVKPNSNSAEI